MNRIGLLLIVIGCLAVAQVATILVVGSLLRQVRDLQSRTRRLMYAGDR